jgi:bifunctional NMN adenylyltransferase/nudix hydrolase
MHNRNVGTPAPAAFHSYHMAVFVGRFQPAHNGHLTVIEQALESSDTLLILVGSCDKPRDTFNPFTFDERKQMILGSLPEAERARVLILPLVDHTYNDAQWVIQVQERAVEARAYFGLDHFAKIALVGHSKDHTSFYLKLFPQWSSMQVANYRGVSATPIREQFFATGEVNGDVPDHVHAFLADYARSDTWNDLVGEFAFVEKYKEPYKALPYPPVFVTVDAVVVQSGHVLLVERRARPGKGLLALPGGFLNAGEKIADAVVRELREETKIKVPEPVLRGSLVESRVFDDPHRSARGRTITHAFYFKLKDDVALPKVKGGDDATKAFFMPIGELRRDQLFEDHFGIISAMVATTDR